MHLPRPPSRWMQLLQRAGKTSSTAGRRCICAWGLISLGHSEAAHVIAHAVGARVNCARCATRRLKRGRSLRKFENEENRARLSRRASGLMTGVLRLGMYALRKRNVQCPSDFSFENPLCGRRKALTGGEKNGQAPLARDTRQHYTMSFRSACTNLAAGSSVFQTLNRQS